MTKKRKLNSKNPKYSTDKKEKLVIVKKVPYERVLFNNKNR